MANDDVRLKIATFLGDALASQGEFLVDKVVLMHTPPRSNRRDYLRTWKRSNEVDRPMFAADKSVVDRLTRAILDRAEHQLDVIGGTNPVRFKIAIEQIDGTPTVFPFALAPETDDEDDDGPGHGGGDRDDDEIVPSRDMLVAETMRQNRELHQRMENLFDKAVSGMARSISQLAEQNDRLQAVLTKRELEREQMLVRVEEAAGKKHEREVEGALVAAKVERDDLITKKALGLLPVLTSRLLESGRDKGKDGEGKGDEKPSSSAP